MFLLQWMNILVVPVYTLMTAAALSSLVIPYLYSLSLYGKLNSTPLTSTTSSRSRNSNNAGICHSMSSILDWVANSRVNKSWFTTYYLVGLISSMWTCWNANSYLSASSCSVNNNYVCFLETTLLWFLLFLHLARRLYECMYIHKWGSSSMNIIALLMGAIYYVMLPFVFIPSYNPSTSPLMTSANNNQSISFLCGNKATRECILVLGTVLCIFGQYQQHIHHVALAKLRKTAPEKKGKEATRDHTANGSCYKLPQGHWFKFVSSPHYLAEIIIYIGFLVLQLCSTTFDTPWQTKRLPNTYSIFEYYSAPCYKKIALMMWIFTNLSITAHRNHKWYHREFANYPGNPVSHRKALIPFLW